MSKLQGTDLAVLFTTQLSQQKIAPVSLLAISIPLLEANGFPLCHQAGQGSCPGDLCPLNEFFWPDFKYLGTVSAEIEFDPFLD